ncbi:MAG: GNAT family N-acetyltransferase [Bacillaceae bacterium]|nr:GNAT family N-acetyltransferase [Bacillaceae bacterium]
MFETERCYINTLREPDYIEVKELYENEEVRKYLGGIRSENSFKEVFEEMLNSAGEGSYYWIVRDKYSDKFVGLVSLDPHHEGVHLEISYQFLPNWWGKGYAKEVVTWIVNYALNELKQSKVLAETQTANKSSCILLEKIGMKLERKVNRFGAEQAIYSIESYYFN